MGGATLKNRMLDAALGLRYGRFDEHFKPLIVVAIIFITIVTPVTAQNLCGVELAVGRNADPNMHWAMHEDVSNSFSQLISEDNGWGNTSYKDKEEGKC